MKLLIDQLQAQKTGMQSLHHHFPWFCLEGLPSCSFLVSSKLQQLYFCCLFLLLLTSRLSAVGGRASDVGDGLTGPDCLC
jgi:hypothetical protein